MPINMNGGAQAHAQNHAQGDRVPPPWERLENSPYVELISNQGVNGGKGLPNFPYQGFQALMDNPASQKNPEMPGMPGIIARLLEEVGNSEDNGGGNGEPIGGGGTTGGGGAGGSTGAGGGAQDNTDLP